MNKPKLLSGEQLVHKGGLKNNVSLPEIGLKDIIPNGSWLEQKQTQSALEARYQLVEAERIEKCGVLSHAVWREDQMLAEVTKQVGGYWHHLGHHMNKKIYLNPEEALYLIEVNCLQLKYNDVTVSLQQAYSLLLRQEIPILKYKVYASLSRLGYKVFRYTEPKLKSPDKPKDDKSKQDDSKLNNTGTSKQDIDVENDRKSHKMPPDEKSVENVNKQTVISDNISIKEDSNDVQDTAVNSTIDIDLTLTDTNDVSKVENEAEPNQIEDIAEHANVKGIVKIESSEKQDSMKSGHSARNMNFDSDTPCEIRKGSNQCVGNADNANVYRNASIMNNTTGMYNINRKDYQRKRHIFKNKYIFKNIKPREVHKYFKNIPEMLQTDTVTISLPREHIPDNINSEKSIYEINLKTVTTRQASSPSTDTTGYSEVDESTDARRIESSSITGRPQGNQVPVFASNVRFPRQPFSFNQFHYWRSRHSFFPFNVFYQRPFLRHMSFPLRFNFYSRQLPGFCGRPQQPFFRQFPTPFAQNTNMFYNNTSNNMSSNYPTTSNATNNNTNSTTTSRKRTRVTDPDDQMFRLNCIKRLAFKLKMQQHRTDIRPNLIDFLQSQIQTYNSKYTPIIRLTDEMDLVENDVIDTITLDDDDVNKKTRSNIIDHYDEHLSNIKQLALELKVLVSRDLSTPRYRRALSSVVKTFNKSFNADIYIDTNFEVVDRRNIVLASDSDSDCVLEDKKSKQTNRAEDNTSKQKKPGKRLLRNPFNVLKRLSENNKLTSASCSKQDDAKERTDITTSHHNKYNKCITNTFSKEWLPTENDFGRAEIPPRNLMLSRLIDSNKQEFLYEFIKNQSCKFINWIDVKLMFFENMEAAAALFESENDSECNTEFDSIIKPEDCTDMPSVLKKLSIIPNYKEVPHGTNFKIDFDVYNRDVKNLRKSDLPKPHFRIICLKESSGLPSGADITALHSKYDSNVPIIFAVVGQSISYLQMKPMDLPVYIPGSDSALD